jgi:hypothetical protein
MTPKKTEPKRSADFWFEITITLFGEIAFVILPLVVILLIRAFMNVPVGDMLLLPEWTFASIVVLSSGLDKFVKLKAEGQADTSERMYVGIRIVTLMMIFAVLVLALAVARQHGLQINERLLALSQITLLIMACLFLLVAVYSAVDLAWIEYNLPTGVARSVMRHAAARGLRKAEMEMRYVKWAMRRWHALHNDTQNGESHHSTSELLDDELYAVVHRVWGLAHEIDMRRKVPPKGGTPSVSLVKSADQESDA